jgi:uncharacterized protein
MLANELLTMLRCPENRTPLTTASSDLLRRVNAAIRERRVVNRAGQTLELMLDGGLVREDGAVLYPIIDGIPVLLRDDGILLEGI